MTPLLDRRDRIIARSLAVSLFVAAVVVGVDSGLAWPVVLALVAISALAGGWLALAQLMVGPTEGTDSP